MDCIVMPRDTLENWMLSVNVLNRFNIEEGSMPF